MSDFPERLRLRDTKLFDDLGGAGQRIFTTAGQGYEKQEYVRADVYKAEMKKLRELLSDGKEIVAEFAPGFRLWMKDVEAALNTEAQE